jgi:phosphoribosylamine--glycine ligase
MAGRVLIIGSGGREHALAWKLTQSEKVNEVLAAPGSDAMGACARLVDAQDSQAWVRAALEHEVDLVVIGPEKPLVEGVADRLREHGVAVFGPSARAAQLEGDKSYAKEFMRAAGVPCAVSQSFTELASALEWLHRNPGPCVVKASGLAAGKGVIVCDNSAQAEAALRTMLLEGAFGAAGEVVLLEERLYGPELSVFVLLDGKDAAWFAPSRDHKRLRDGDSGPNTGGMGAYTPVAEADEGLMNRVVDEILTPTLGELKRRELDYRGLLYLGLILTEAGPKLLEYNCRFGDPETQVVLAAFPGDLYPLLHGAAVGSLPVEGPLPLQGAAVGVVLASEGYPARPRLGRVIEGLDALPEEALVFHAGTRLDRGRWLTAGGRVLCAVSRSATVSSAKQKASALATSLQFEGVQMRTDIAAKEAGE